MGISEQASGMSFERIGGVDVINQSKARQCSRVDGYGGVSAHDG
jgi:hypothetical protein